MPLYAIIEESGGQRKVAEGDTIAVDLLAAGAADVGAPVTFDKVLLIGGDQTRIGSPYVPGASVSAEVTEPLFKGEKLEIWKFRTKKNYRRHTGHRQQYTRVKITAIRA